jgi:maleate cis-trans isomerase
MHATRILTRGALTPAAVRSMEQHVERAVEELAATGVDTIAYCDMVTTFIMEPGWNEAKVAAIAARSGSVAISAWTALRDALAALGVRRAALGTPYPREVHALALPFFAAREIEIVSDATLDIVEMREVPTVSRERLMAFLADLSTRKADALILLATDLPTFGVISEVEHERGIPVLTSNQTLLWRALRALGHHGSIADLGRLFHV